MFESEFQIGNSGLSLGLIFGFQLQTEMSIFQILRPLRSVGSLRTRF